VLKRILLTIAFLLTCATVQAQEGIFSAPDCSTRITSPVANKTMCFDQTLNRWRSWNGSSWVNVSKPIAGPWTLAEGGTNATSAAGALSSLGAAEASHNHDLDYADIAHNHTGVYQPLDSDLTAIAALNCADDKILKKVLGAWSCADDGGGGGGGTDDQIAAEVPFTPAGSLAADDVQEALQELDTEKLASSAVSAFMLTVLDDAAAVNARTTLGLEIGVNVQSFHDNLQDIADFTPTDDTIIIGNGSDYESKALPNCPDSGGNHLNYTAASNAFSCGTSGGGTFTGLTTGTIPKAAAGDTLVDSAVSEDPTNVYSSKPIVIGDCATNCFGFDASDVTGASGNDIYVPDGGSTAVKGTTATSNNFLTHVTAEGVQAKAQPAFSNLSGTATAAQIPSSVKDHTKNITILDPTTADTNKIQIQFASAVTLQAVGCSTPAGTMTIQFDKRAEATPNTAGTDALTAVLVCDSDRQATTSFSSAGVAANQVLNLQITATASSPTVGRIHIIARPD
jgi:hypothetical protein